MRFTTYDLDTGRITATWEVPDEETALLNINPGTEGTIEGHVDGSRYYRRPNGTLAEYPPQPSPVHVWDFAAEAWIDPRTPEDIAAEKAAALAAERAEAVLPKETFLWRCMEVNLLNPDEAKTASRGYIPASFEAAFLSLPAEMQDQAEVTWPAVRNVARMDPLVLALAEAQGITSPEMDALFGITPPQPPA